MIWYLLTGFIVGACIDITRPARFDKESMAMKIAVPVTAGFFWPLVVLYFVYCFIREMVT